MKLLQFFIMAEVYCEQIHRALVLYWHNGQKNLTQYIEQCIARPQGSETAQQQRTGKASKDFSLKDSSVHAYMLMCEGTGTILQCRT